MRDFLDFLQEILGYLSVVFFCALGVVIGGPVLAAVFRFMCILVGFGDPFR